MGGWLGDPEADCELAVLAKSQEAVQAEYPEFLNHTSRKTKRIRVMVHYVVLVDEKKAK